MPTSPKNQQKVDRIENPEASDTVMISMSPSHSVKLTRIFDKAQGLVRGGSNDSRVPSRKISSHRIDTGLPTTEKPDQLSSPSPRSHRKADAGCHEQCSSTTDHVLHTALNIPDAPWNREQPNRNRGTSQPLSSKRDMDKADGIDSIEDPGAYVGPNTTPVTSHVASCLAESDDRDDDEKYFSFLGVPLPEPMTESQLFHSSSKDGGYKVEDWLVNIIGVTTDSTDTETVTTEGPYRGTGLLHKKNASLSLDSDKENKPPMFYQPKRGPNAGRNQQSDQVSSLNPNAVPFTPFTPINPGGRFQREQSTDSIKPEDSFSGNKPRDRIPASPQGPFPMEAHRKRHWVSGEFQSFGQDASKAGGVIALDDEPVRELSPNVSIYRRKHKARRPRVTGAMFEPAPSPCPAPLQATALCETPKGNSIGTEAISSGRKSKPGSPLKTSITPSMSFTENGKPRIQSPQK
ncbi:MAG: hypothetical protein M1825_006029 [Sarcosagium campestre]|nr:MAG: hypothetical protein M1825_006029 [Sarcosagium campestre]